MKKLLLILTLPLLIGAACTVDNSKEESPATDDKPEVVEQNNESNEAIDEITEVFDQAYVLYENKAIGYTIMRPEKWYWQHFMKSDLKAAGSNELIDDYLVIDKNGVTGLGSEYLGQIVIEKSRMNLEELANDKIGYSKKEVTVVGQSALRFEIKTDENHLLFPNKTMIEYNFIKNGNTFRLMYISNDNEESETIFEKIVSSFAFVE